MHFLTIEHQERTRKLEEEFDEQFTQNDKEAMALLYIAASSPKLENKARESLDENGFFQIRLFKQQTQGLERDNQVLSSLAIAIFNKDSFTLDTLSVLNNEQLNIALEAIKHCYKDDGGIYDIESRPMILQETTYTPETSYVGQTQVAEMLQEHGIDMDRRKVSVYYKREHLPEPDAFIGTSPGWRKSAIEKWIKDYEAGRVVERRKRN